MKEIHMNSVVKEEKGVELEYIIISENSEEPVKKCNTIDEIGLVEYFGLAHFTILRLVNGKIEWAHWTYSGIEWLTPDEIKYEK